MKKNLILFLFLICCWNNALKAQIVSPGIGLNLTLTDLIQDPSNAITSTQSGFYAIHQDVTLSSNDTLTLTADVQQITFDPAVTIIVHGIIICEERDSLLSMSGIRDSTSQTYFNLRFEEAAPSIIQQILFENCNGIYLGESNITFQNCEFRNFTNKVINYQSCNPTITNCYFHHNQQEAIGSAINFMGSPKIINNIFYNNVLENSNRPQINIGPGATDTILILSNHIKGVASSMSGGIGIANMLGLGNSTIIVKGNIIEKNRYGYTQNGKNIFGIIEDNILKNNDLETNPMNGGSGISIYGYDSTCAAKIRRNEIFGNFWGITTIYYCNVDAGTANDYGNNLIYNNITDGITYGLYNNSFSPITAIGNYWGGNSDSIAESVIFHYPDAPSQNLGEVTYLPIIQLNPELEACNININGTIYPTQQINDSTFTANLIYNWNTTIDEIEVLLQLPFGIKDSLLSYNFSIDSCTFVYQLSTPHNHIKNWYIHINNTLSIPNSSSALVKIFPNPTKEGIIFIQLADETPSTTKIYSSTGKLLASHQSQQNTFTINLSNYTPGIYFIKIDQAKQSSTHKIIIQ